jgi:hypothetical protein
MGFSSKEVLINNEENQNIVLMTTISREVVTALGIKRDKRVLDMRHKN